MRTTGNTSTEDVSPVSGQPGIYDSLIPILQQWKQQYNFVGSYYVTIGDDPANGSATNWAVSAPFYRAILATGSEIGNHSYTHLIKPPTVDANGAPVKTQPIPLAPPPQPAWLAGPGGPTVTKAQAEWLKRKDEAGWFSSNFAGLATPDRAAIRDLVLQHFTHHAMARGYEQIYRTLR